jgi:hypothetical protein
MSPVSKMRSGSDPVLARWVRVLCSRWSASDWCGYLPEQSPSEPTPVMLPAPERPLGSGAMLTGHAREPAPGSSRWNSWRRLLVEPGLELALGPDPMLAGQARWPYPGSLEPCWCSPVAAPPLGCGLPWWSWYSPSLERGLGPGSLLAGCGRSCPGASGWTWGRYRFLPWSGLKPSLVPESQLRSGWLLADWRQGRRLGSAASNWNSPERPSGVGLALPGPMQGPCLGSLKPHWRVGSCCCLPYRGCPCCSQRPSCQQPLRHR